MIRDGVEQTLFFGPNEKEECLHHPDCFRVTHWYWWVETAKKDDLESQVEAIENGDCTFVESCEECDAEYNEEDLP